MKSPISATDSARNIERAARSFARKARKRDWPATAPPNDPLQNIADFAGDLADKAALNLADFEAAAERIGEIEHAIERAKQDGAYRAPLADAIVNADFDLSVVLVQAMSFLDEAVAFRARGELSQAFDALACAAARMLRASTLANSAKAKAQGKKGQQARNNGSRATK